MNWTTLIATLVGAVIATGSGLLIEVRRDRRTTEAEWRQARRELYGAFLSALSQTRHELLAMTRDGHMPNGDRLSAARDSFARCYELRHQVELLAPQSVVRPAREYFRSVRTLREAVGGGLQYHDPERATVEEAVTLALRSARDAMRSDMKTDAVGSS